jgi:ABC-2 type transport system ATP-binding protein
MKRNDTVITVKGLTKSFKNTPVLRGVDFEVDRGSVFAMLGSNGAGKTTTIKILTTLLRPDEGSATVCGFDVVRQPENVRGVISLTGQNVAADYILTGRENLKLIGKLRHLRDTGSRAEALLARFDLQKDADKRISEYSGGMRRKLDLAMSLMGSPSVVFLDEPTVGLDPQARLAMWDTIRELTKTGVTVFLTTQYLEEAEQLADRIAILNEGKIVANGTIEELRKILPEGEVEMVRKQPTLEQVFLAIVKNKEAV